MSRTDTIPLDPWRIGALPTIRLGGIIANHPRGVPRTRGGRDIARRVLACHHPEDRVRLARRTTAVLGG